MFKKNSLQKFLVFMMLMTVLISCKKEEPVVPSVPAGSGKTLLYIRAVDKDSTVIESQQVTLE